MGLYFLVFYGGIVWFELFLKNLHFLLCLINDSSQPSFGLLNFYFELGIPLIIGAVKWDLNFFVVIFILILLYLLFLKTLFLLFTLIYLTLLFRHDRIWFHLLGGFILILFTKYFINVFELFVDLQESFDRKDSAYYQSCYKPRSILPCCFYFLVIHLCFCRILAHKTVELEHSESISVVTGDEICIVKLLLNLYDSEIVGASLAFWINSQTHRSWVFLSESKLFRIISIFWTICM
jgi:hypothetical protein